MAKTLTAADRSALIRLASTMVVGSSERRAILAGLSHIAADDKVQVLNENGRKVWVSRETLKGPKGKNYKPIKGKGEGDKGKGEGDKGKSKGVKIPKIEDDMKDTLKRVQEDIKKYDDFRAKLKKGPLSSSAAADFRELEEHVDQGRGPISELIEYFEFIGREDLDTPEAAGNMVRLMGKKASDRKSLIRLASALPVGSDERKVLLAGLSR